MLRSVKTLNLINSLSLILDVSKVAILEAPDQARITIFFRILLFLNLFPKEKKKGNNVKYRKKKSQTNMVNKNHKQASCLPLDLPLPRFVGLKNEPEMRYSAIPPSIDGQGGQCGIALGSVSWTPADRSAFRPLEANTEKKVSLRVNI